MNSYKIELKWAIIFTIMSMTWMGIENATGLHDINIKKHALLTNIIAIPAILIYVFALIDKRKNDYNGSMEYKQAFVSGLILSVITAALSPINVLATYYLISPHFFTNMINYAVSQKMMTQEAAESYFSLRSYMLQSVIGALFMGTVTGAIVGFFVKKR